MRRDERPSLPKRRKSFDGEEDSIALSDAMNGYETVKSASSIRGCGEDGINILLKYLDIAYTDDSDNEAPATERNWNFLDQIPVCPTRSRATPNDNFFRGRRGTKKSTYLASLEMHHMHPAASNSVTDRASCSNLPSVSTDAETGPPVPDQTVLRKPQSCPKMNPGKVSSAPDNGSRGSQRVTFSDLKHKYKAKSCRDLASPLPTIEEFCPYRRSSSTGLLTSDRHKKMYRRPKHSHSPTLPFYRSSNKDNAMKEDRKQDRLLVRQSLKASVDEALSLVDVHRNPGDGGDGYQGPSCPSSLSSPYESSQNAVFEIPSCGNNHAARQKQPRPEDHPTRVVEPLPPLSLHPFELLVQPDLCRSHETSDPASKSPPSLHHRDDSVSQAQPPKPPCRKLSPSVLYLQTLALKLAGAGGKSSSDRSKKRSASRKATSKTTAAAW